MRWLNVEVYIAPHWLLMRKLAPDSAPRLVARGLARSARLGLCARVRRRGVSPAECGCSMACCLGAGCG